MNLAEALDGLTLAVVGMKERVRERERERDLATDHTIQGRNPLGTIGKPLCTLSNN